MSFMWEHEANNPYQTVKGRIDHLYNERKKAKKQKGSQ